MSDYIRPGGYNMLPPVVKNLLIINVLMYLASMIFPGTFHISLDEILGLHYFGASMFYPFQFVTYMFMHSMTDFSHILFNMLALWMFGTTLENYWGAKKFLFFYLFTGIGAAVVHYTIFYFQIQPMLNTIDQFVVSPDLNWFMDFINKPDFVATEEVIFQLRSTVAPAMKSGNDAAMLQASVDFMNFYREEYLNMHVVVGASGAVYGLLLAFGMLFPNSLIYLYFLFPIKAKWFVLAFGAIELFSGIRNNPADNVAHFAHLGGMLFGLILILYWKKKGLNSNFNRFS